MFIEGKIDLRYLDVLIAAGYEPDWICNTPEEAAEKGYELELNDNDAVVRIWVDVDTENFFEPKDLIHGNKKLLALMATCGHEGLREFANIEIVEAILKEKKLLPQLLGIHPELDKRIAEGNS